MAMFSFALNNGATEEVTQYFNVSSQYCLNYFIEILLNSFCQQIF